MNSPLLFSCLTLWLSRVSSGVFVSYFVVPRACSLAGCRKSTGAFGRFLFWFSVSPAPLPPAIPYSHTMTGSRPVFAWPESSGNTHICRSTLGRTQTCPHKIHIRKQHTLTCKHFFHSGVLPWRKELIYSCRGFRGVTVCLFVCAQVCVCVCVRVGDRTQILHFAKNRKGGVIIDLDMSQVVWERVDSL